jgi:hypothetical protein
MTIVYASLPVVGIIACAGADVSAAQRVQGECVVRVRNQVEMSIASPLQN